MAKVGRKHKPYPASWGENIDGLYKCPDGRWRITATGERVTQPDERLAVLRFRQWQAKRDGRQVRFDVPLNDAQLAELKPAAVAPNVFSEQYSVLEQPAFLRFDDPTGAVAHLEQHVPEAVLWAWFRQQIIRRAKYVAEQTGIEQIGYLADLPKPTPSPTLDEVGSLYFGKSKVSGHWLRKTRAFWQEFSDSVGVSRLRDVTQPKVVEYLDDVLESADSPTFAKHRFGQIKTILNFARKRGQWSDDVARVLNYCRMLVPPASTSLDPNPIAPTHYQQLLDVADEHIKAVLLLCLNACLYGQEAADLRWADLDLDAGVLVANRGKTAVARVAVLWPRTVEALRRVPRKTDCVFITAATKQQHNGNTINKAFRDLRAAAPGVPMEVKLCHVRDGAYTAAVEGEGVQYEHARILAGHRTGMADHYVKRRPKLVADACSAIERAYFGG